MPNTGQKLVPAVHKCGHEKEPPNGGYKYTQIWLFDCMSCCYKQVTEAQKVNKAVLKTLEEHIRKSKEDKVSRKILEL